MRKQETTHDGRPLNAELAQLNHKRPATIAGLAVCITGIVPGCKGDEAEHLAHLAGARTVKQVSSKTQLLVIGQNAGRAKIDRAAVHGTPTITAREFLAYV